MGALAGRHALVTGAGGGIGAAIARALACEGVRLTLIGRRLEPLRLVAADCPDALALSADIVSEADWTRVIAAAQAAHGPFDLVIANAGAAASAPFLRTDLAAWNAMIAVNLTGAYLTAQAGLRAGLADPLRSGETQSGNKALRRLIFVASTAGLKGYPYVAPYCAAKHGVVGLMRALAAEYAATPLTVNAVCPGFTDTPLLEASISAITAKTGRSASQAREALARSNPQGRMITPQEVAANIVWLCQPAAASITGQALSISGGEI